MSKFRDTTNLIFQGHEGWLEFRSSHGHHDSPVEVLYKWGHNMKVDGLCKKEILKAYYIDPDGKKSELTIDGPEDSAYKAAFVPENHGFYQAVVVADVIWTVSVDGKYLNVPKKECEFPLEASAFTEYANAIIPVGHDLEGEIRPAGSTLELAPLFWKPWKAGDTVKLRVSFKGAPLAASQVVMIYGMAEDNEEPEVKETDSEGLVSFTFEKPGYYLALVRHVDNDDAREGYYDRRNYTNTLFMMVTK
jgi:uncharacterized GH25 family protein